MPRSRDRDQVLVLITDGEDQDSYAEEAAKQAAERGVKIFTVGLGDSREGARIPIRDDSGRLTYLQYEGQERWSKRNDDLLKKIALTTGGAYIPAGTQAYDLGQVYADHLAGLTRSEYQAEKRKRYREQFQWFVGLGVLLLLLGNGHTRLSSRHLPLARAKRAKGTRSVPLHDGSRPATALSPKLRTVAARPTLLLALACSFPAAAARRGSGEQGPRGDLLVPCRRLQAGGRGLQRSRVGPARRSANRLRPWHGPGGPRG